MKKTFASFYPPTDDEFKALWQNSTIVLDTNVLLELYRLPTAAQNELFAVLENLKERLWIPHQAGLEFERNRIGVIASEKKRTEEALSEARDMIAATRTVVDDLQIEKRSLGLETAPLLEQVETAVTALCAALEKTHEAQLEISSFDPVRDRLNTIFDGRVGSGPTKQEELDCLAIDGEERYANKIPPGYEDSHKDKNPNAAEFFWNGIRYKRKFGDLIFWRQLIEHAKSSSLKSIILVSGERKEDWWWREHGKTIGARPELVEEIKRLAGVDIFWMYSNVQFITHANQHVAAKVSDTTIAELKNVSSLPSGTNLEPTESRVHPNASRHYKSFYNNSHFMHQERRAIDAVANWLTRTYGMVTENKGFPDLIAGPPHKPFGFEVKYVRQFERMLFNPSVINAMLRGYMEVNEGRLRQFSVVVLIDQDDFSSIARDGRTSVLQDRIGRLLEKYPIASLVIGCLIDDIFEPLHIQEREDKSYKDLWDEP